MHLLYVTGAEELDEPELAQHARDLLHDRFIAEPITTIVLTLGRKAIDIWAREIAEACGLCWIAYQSNGWRLPMRGPAERWYRPGTVPDVLAALLSDVTTKLAKGWCFEAAEVGGDCFPSCDPVLEFARRWGSVDQLSLAPRSHRRSIVLPQEMHEPAGLISRRR